MPGFTKTLVALGETATARFGFCLVVVMSRFLFGCASDSFATQPQIKDPLTKLNIDLRVTHRIQITQ